MSYINVRVTCRSIIYNLNYIIRYPHVPGTDIIYNAIMLVYRRVQSSRVERLFYCGILWYSVVIKCGILCGAIYYIYICMCIILVV